MDTRTVETVCAIRMACRAWLKTQGNDSPCVVVTHEATPVKPSSPSLTAILPKDASAPTTASAVTDFARSHGMLPALVTDDGLGLFAVGASRSHTAAILSAAHNGQPLPAGYPTPPRPGRLCGCVAVVTGSAQGFGKGIAEELIAEGAMVTIADVNDPLGRSCVRELEQRFGSGCAVYAHADVASLASSQEMVQATVAAFGGVDMFVANAGVLKAGSIEEMDEKSFDLVTTVNYKGFFIGVKAVAPVMKLQNRLDPNHFMDIIQINSKSGLEGSNKNFAYAGGKFGGIGLTQSFALELVPHNIKVNAICPGNFFEGPLWSDPEKGLFVQYLRAGKVPGAKTIEDVKQSYVSKVPMKRGCSPRDVARAIFYLHEQEYETGQAVPVTGGQVMLN